MRMLRILFFLTLLAPEVLNAQSFYAVRKERSLIATFGTGGANYLGEMVNPGSLGKTRNNLIVGAEYYFTPRISGRAEFTYFNIAGADAAADDDRVERNLSFYAHNFELSTVATISLFPIGQRFYQRSKLNFYGFIGGGLLFMNPKAIRQNGEKVALQPLETEGVHYSKFQFVIPFGFGIKYMINPFWNIMVEAGFRKTFTDYLDDVSSKRYPDDPLTFFDNDLSREMNDRRRERDPDYPVGPGVGVRGNPDNDDGYLLMNLKVQYYLPLDMRNSQRKLYNRKRKAYYRRR